MSPTAVSPLNYQPILIFDDTFKLPKGKRRRIALSTTRPAPPRSSLSAIIVFLRQQVQRLDLSQVGPDHFVRVASEDVYGWIEQLNPTVNVIRASSATVGDGAGLQCLNVSDTHCIRSTNHAVCAISTNLCYQLPICPIANNPPKMK